MVGDQVNDHFKVAPVRMANQQASAGAGGGLERLARALRDRSRPWDAGTRQTAVRAVDDLKVLVRKVRSWSEADTANAQQLAETLQSRVGGGGARPSGAVRAPAAGERAFVAQQGASVASALLAAWVSGTVDQVAGLPDALRAVTVDDVARVARAVFQGERVAEYVVRGTGGGR